MRAVLISEIEPPSKNEADRAGAGADALHFINKTERLRLISRVILRCMCAGIPVTRRGRILPLSVTNFRANPGFL
jgi:hypothetical protein